MRTLDSRMFKQKSARQEQEGWTASWCKKNLNSRVTHQNLLCHQLKLRTGEPCKPKAENATRLQRYHWPYLKKPTTRGHQTHEEEKTKNPLNCQLYRLMLCKANLQMLSQSFTLAPSPHTNVMLENKSFRTTADLSRWWDLLERKSCKFHFIQNWPALCSTAEAPKHSLIFPQSQLSIEDDWETQAATCPSQLSYCCWRHITIEKTHQIVYLPHPHSLGNQDYSHLPTKSKQ